MNLQQVTVGQIAVVNPQIPLSVQVSTGNAENADLSVTPTYAPAVTVSGQVQPMTWRDIQMADGLNLQGTRRVIYINGHINGLVRSKNKGGDLITDPDGNVWLVALVAESWSDWCRVLATLQNGS